MLILQHQIRVDRAVPIRQMLRIRRLSRCRAIVCSQYEQACEQAPACSIAPSGTARRNAQIQICRHLSNFNNKRYIEQLSEDSCSSLFRKSLNIVDLRNSQTESKYDLS